SFVRVVPEHAAMKLVRSGRRNRRDRGATDVRLTGLVVLRDYLVLGDGGLRERIAAARVLAGYAALQHVIFLADTVDEDIHRPLVLGAAANVGAALLPLHELHAGGQVRKSQEIAVH